MNWNYKYVRTYLAFCRWAFATTREGRRIQITRFGREYDQDGWKAEFMRALHLRINIKGGLAEVGRKSDSIYQRELMRDCMDIREIRRRQLRVYQLRTKELRARFGHLLARYDD